MPANLLIIGTMNTADRSIALLDVALRRRFTFVELMPQPELLGEVACVPLGKLLTALNRKLEAYLDREHQIGHSYFMGLNSAGDLRSWLLPVRPLSFGHEIGTYRCRPGNLLGPADNSRNTDHCGFCVATHRRRVDGAGHRTRLPGIDRRGHPTGREVCGVAGQ